MAEFKGYKPTKRKIDQARKEGRVLKSQFLTQISVIIATICALSATLGWTWVRIEMLLQYCWLQSGEGGRLACYRSGVSVSGVILAVSVGAGALAALIMEVLQIGWHPQIALAMPKPSRIDPFSGLKRLWTNLSEIWWVVLKAVLIAGCYTYLFRAVWIWLLDNSAPNTLGTFFRISAVFGGATAISFSTLALLDFLHRRHKFLIENSMSAEELRKEHREHEGDPLIKARTKSLHEALLLQDLTRRVRSSKVILVEKAEMK